MRASQRSRPWRCPLPAPPLREGRREELRRRRRLSRASPGDGVVRGSRALTPRSGKSGPLSFLPGPGAVSLSSGPASLPSPQAWLRHFPTRCLHISRGGSDLPGRGAQGPVPWPSWVVSSPQRSPCLPWRRRERALAVLGRTGRRFLRSRGSWTNPGGLLPFPINKHSTPLSPVSLVSCTDVKPYSPFAVSRF